MKPFAALAALVLALGMVVSQPSYAQSIVNLPDGTGVTCPNGCNVTINKDGTYSISDSQGAPISIKFPPPKGVVK